MPTTLHDHVHGLKNKLEMLAFSPGYIDIGQTEGVRRFYEVWAELNEECIKAGYEDGGGDLSFVADQLRKFLANFPADQTRIGVLEVFPLCGHSALLFGSYMAKLDSIAQSRPSVPA